MHERFKYKISEELLGKSAELGLELPFSDDISALLSPLVMSGFKFNNRFVVQPMEGYDSEPDGSPSALTARRYRRYAEGGSSIIWFEAVAVSSGGRSNPGQLWLNKSNLDKFSGLVEETRRCAGMKGFNPFLVVQLTHSGRYSRPGGAPRPLAAALNPVLDRNPPVILSDDDLKRIQDEYVSSARLASAAGFDAVDLKACHGYLMVELLSAKLRQNSIYGGNEPESRFRFMLETFDRIKNEVPGMTITTRLNISDCYKGGFGVSDDETPDASEPLMLVGELRARGIQLINLSMGSPYHNPHVTRPYDTPVPGQYVPSEHPLEGVMRMISATQVFQEKFPQISFVGSGYSWLRQFAPNVGAAVIRNGGASFMGLGRSSFAYPSLPLDIMTSRRADPSKVCITCSGCSRLIKNLRHGGCVIRDREIYGKELKKLISDGK